MGLKKFIKENKDLITIGLAATGVFISYKIYKSRQKPVFYQVKKGDTLSKIARKLGTTWQELAKLNHIKNPDLIKPYQILRVK
jgi:LysM repeat protein